MQISDIDNGIRVTTGNLSILREYALKHLEVKNCAVCNLLSNGSENKKLSGTIFATFL